MQACLRITSRCTKHPLCIFAISRKPRNFFLNKRHNSVGCLLLGATSSLRLAWVGIGPSPNPGQAKEGLHIVPSEMEKPLRVQNRTQGTAYTEEEKEKNKEEGWGEEKYSLQNLRSVCHTSSSSLAAIQGLVWMQLNRHRTNLYSFSFLWLVHCYFPAFSSHIPVSCCLEHGLPCLSSSLTAILLLVLFLSLSWNTLLSSSANQAPPDHSSITISKLQWVPIPGAEKGPWETEIEV